MEVYGGGLEGGNALMNEMRCLWRIRCGWTVCFSVRGGVWGY